MLRFQKKNAGIRRRSNINYNFIFHYITYLFIALNSACVMATVKTPATMASGTPFIQMIPS